MNQNYMLNVRGRLEIDSCVVNGRLSGRAAVYVAENGHCTMLSSTVEQAGTSGLVNAGGDVLLYENQFRLNRQCGVTLLAGSSVLRYNVLQQNQQYGLRMLLTSSADIERNDLRHNSLGAFDVEKDPVYLVKKANHVDN